MGLLGFLGGYEDNPMRHLRDIYNRQFSLADSYRQRARSYFDGSAGNELYQRNARQYNSLLATAINNMQRDLASRGLNSYALNKQNTLETSNALADKLYEANLGAWKDIQELGMRMEGLGREYEGLGTASAQSYGEGEKFKAEQQNSFLNNLIGLGGGLIAGGFNPLGFLSGISARTPIITPGQRVPGISAPIGGRYNPINFMSLTTQNFLNNLSLYDPLRLGGRI